MNVGGSGIPQFQAHATLTPALLRMPADGRDSVLQVQDVVPTSGKAPPPARASALRAAGGRRPCLGRSIRPPRFLGSQGPPRRRWQQGRSLQGK